MTNEQKRDEILRHISDNYKMLLEICMRCHNQRGYITKEKAHEIISEAIDMFVRTSSNKRKLQKNWELYERGEFMFKFASTIKEFKIREDTPYSRKWRAKDHEDIILKTHDKEYEIYEEEEKDYVFEHTKIIQDIVTDEQLKIWFGELWFYYKKIFWLRFSDMETFASIAQKINSRFLGF